MKRFALAMLIFVELTATAMLAVALRYGRIDVGAHFYVYLLGALAGVALFTGWALPASKARRLTVHGLLLLGCIAFSMPFVWLLSTSFKYDEELLAYPPRWEPSIPRAIDQSPYLTDEESPTFERPEGVDAREWAALRPKLDDAIWARAHSLLNADAAGTFGEERLRSAMSPALWSRATSGIATALWTGPRDRLLAAIAQRIDQEAIDDAWESVHRALMLRDLTVTDDDGVSTRPGDGPSNLSEWKVVEGDASVRRGADDAAGRPSPLTIAYDVSARPRVIVSGDFALSVAANRLLSITLPMKQDRSWHALRIAVEFDGKRYETADNLYLGERRWQEFTFRLQQKDDRDERDAGIWPLVQKSSASGAFAEPGKLRVVLAIDRASRAVATWRKFTDNYVSAYLASGHRWTYVFNSAYLVVLTVIGQVLSCSMVAYAFARLNWPGRNALFVVLLATMMLPGQVTMVPVFVVFKHLGLYNTLAALWAPSFLGSAFFIFMLRQFMKTIPPELEDAAKIDGCGFFGIYWRIILPLMKPALAAVAIFTFMSTWNDFMGPLIYINDQRLYPLSLGLFEFRTEHGADYGMLMAASTLMTLPVVALFFLAQRYFIEGVTLTGMKA
ncbi:MAG TPA: carbohydrate ABC transporter permease [Tepidisphaeraceae bacterium]|nr:carbohydrate ABC transporter permease [Tepidisphaeraceae bacterium]